jgi:prepilin peptidase CpaA
VGVSFSVAALMVALIGASTDLKAARVPNWLTCSGLFTGFVFRYYAMGWSGVHAALWGALYGGGFLLLPFLAGGIGGGDVKLMAAVGAWLGNEHALKFVLATAIAGGIWALLYLAHRKTRYAISLIAHIVRWDLDSASAAGLRSACHGTSIPYSLAILTGTLFVFVSIFIPIGW